MVEAPDWFVWTFDLLIFAVIILCVLFLKAWLDARKTKGKILIDMREPTGFTERHLVKPDDTGDTVTYEAGVYMLTKPPSADIKPEEPVDDADEDAVKDAALKRYPRIRFVRYPKNPFLGLPMFQTTLRLEEFQRGNPEPIHSFYGRVDKNGKFIDSQITVTSEEWEAQKTKSTAVGIAMDVQERADREKEWARGMANLPNKMVVYILLGVAAICSALGLWL